MHSGTRACTHTHSHIHTHTHAHTHARTHRTNDLVKLEIKINGELAEPLSCVVHRDNAFRTGKALVSKLKELIPRQMFRCAQYMHDTVHAWYCMHVQCAGWAVLSVDCV